MKTTPIPNYIAILDQHYVIKKDSDFCEKRSSLGTTDVNGATIWIAEKFDKSDLPKCRQFQVLCHELVHALFWEIGEEKLYADEKLCQNLGNAICSFLEQNCEWKQ